MPKLAILTDLQILYLIELFENDSINNKKNGNTFKIQY